MDKKLKITLMLLGAFCMPGIPAQSVNLSELIEKVALNNGQYKAAQIRNNAELQSMRSENNLSDPEFGISRSWGEGEAGNKFEMSLSQSFDWPGAYSARKRAADAQAVALENLSRNELFALKLDIKLAMIDIINSRKKLELYSSAMHEIDSLVAIVERDVAKKDVSVLDGNKLRIERIGLAREQRNAQSDFDAACIRLAELNNGNSGLTEIIAQLTDYPDNYLLPDLAVYLDRVKSNNPVLKYQHSLQDALLAKKEAVKKERFPGFNVGLTREVEEGDKFNGFSVSMTLPFFSNRGKSKAVQYEIEASQIETELQNVTADSEIMASHAKASQLLSQINDYGKILNGDDNFRLLRKAFEARHISVLDYIADFSYFTAAKSDYLDLIYQYQTEIAKLDRFND